VSPLADAETSVVIKSNAVRRVVGIYSDFDKSTSFCRKGGAGKLSFHCVRHGFNEVLMYAVLVFNNIIAMPGYIVFSET
jgi:hypothetical protein